MLDGTMTRRRLLGHARWLAGVLAWPALRGGDVPAAASLNEASAAGLRPGPDVYASIGVRPLINARGTYTIISGSTMLPEVRAAMDAAGRHYVHLDELADAIGARLAALTGAEWGLVTSGCCSGPHARDARRASPAGTPICTSASRTSQASPGTKRSSRSTRGTSTTRRCEPSGCA